MPIYSRFILPLRNEDGFVLGFIVFLLALCTLLGIAAMNSTVFEFDIAKNEVIAKQVYAATGSSLQLAVVPLLSTQGVGRWQDNTTEDNCIKIIDGGFLWEGREQDVARGTGWNNGTKYKLAPSGHENAFKPIDDPFDAAADDVKNANGTAPDLRIEKRDQLSIDVDVDKADVAYLAGGVAEFGSGADGNAGSMYKLIYLMDCKGTQPNKDPQNKLSPTAEIIMGYRLIPDAGI